MRSGEYLFLHFVFLLSLPKGFEELIWEMKAGEFSSSYFVYAMLAFLSYEHEIKHCNKLLSFNFNLW